MATDLRQTRGSSRRTRLPEAGGRVIRAMSLEEKLELLHSLRQGESGALPVVEASSIDRPSKDRNEFEPKPSGGLGLPTPRRDLRGRSPGFCYPER